RQSAGTSWRLGRRSIKSRRIALFRNAPPRALAGICGLPALFLSLWSFFVRIVLRPSAVNLLVWVAKNTRGELSELARIVQAGFALWRTTTQAEPRLWVGRGFVA